MVCNGSGIGKFEDLVGKIIVILFVLIFYYSLFGVFKYW